MTTRLAALSLSSLLASACAGSYPQVVRLLESGDYAGGAAWAAGDREKEIALAAGILERAAAAGEDPLGAVRILAAADDLPRKSLARLAAGSAHPAAELAAIASSRRRPPSRDELDRLLSSAFGDVRAYAAATWWDDIGPDRAAELLLDHDPGVRRAAVRSLAHSGGAAYAGALCDAARLDPDASVRAEAARSGRALGQQALDVLREIARSGSPGEAQAALVGLGDLGTDEALALLEERAAGLPDETAVLAGAELARRGVATGRERLLDALTDQRSNVRATAAVNLARAGVDGAEDRLAALLDDEAPRVALIAASLLVGERFAARVIAALRRISDSGGPMADEARDALAARGDETAAEMTARALEGADEETAVRILARAASAPSLRGRIVALLGDPRARVRLAAAEALLR